MLARRSTLPIVSTVLACTFLVHCGPSPEPSVPGPYPPPTAAPTAQPTAVVTASVTAPPTVAPAPAFAAEAKPAAPPHWTYHGEEGPEKWGDLSPEYASCKTGTNQSPIDIVSSKADSDKALKLIDFNYGAPVSLALFNNGHTIQVQNAGAATIKAGGGEYKLIQVHFHSPSEHSVDGKLFVMEAHLVHANDRGELSVIGLLFRKGRENKALAPVFDHIPAETTKDPLPVPGTTIDFAKLIPAKPAYYTYTGSLTTPKCTEGVHWFVLKPLFEVSEAQLERFRHAVHGDTNRPIQPIGTRKVFLVK